MALINCPQCDKRMSTMEDSCPHCGYTDKPRPAGAAPVPRSSQGRLFLSVDSAIPGTPDADQWIRRWANYCGGMLVVGFLCPMMMQGFGGTHLVWQWDLMSGAKAHHVLGGILPLLLGIATLVVGNKFEGVRRAVILFAMAGGTWVLYALLGGGAHMDMSGLSLGSGSGAFVFVLMPLAGCAVAIGNRIRKRYPTESLPRTLAGVGGIVLVVCFLIPLGNRGGQIPLIRVFFESMIWRTVGPILVVVLSLLVYGIIGAFSFMRIRDVASFCRLLSVLARAILVGAPLTILLTYWMFMSGTGIGMAFTLTLKMFSLMYGHLLLFAIGLTSWIEYSMAHRLGRTRGPAAARRPA